MPHGVANLRKVLHACQRWAAERRVRQWVAYRSESLTNCKVAGRVRTNRTREEVLIPDSDCPDTVTSQPQSCSRGTRARPCRTACADKTGCRRERHTAHNRCRYMRWLRQSAVGIDGQTEDTRQAVPGKQSSITNDGESSEIEMGLGNFWKVMHACQRWAKRAWETMDGLPRWKARRNAKWPVANQ